jgi:hypothetical protein
VLRIENAIDMHCHFGPDSIGGSRPAGAHDAFSAVDAAREAHASGHKAIVLKSHSFASPALAANLQQLVPGLQVFGGICTDFPSGGLDPFVVSAALQMGARIVWLPTVHSHCDLCENNKAEKFGVSQPGLRVIDETGRPTKAVQEIFDMVREKDAVLATGHISAEEHHAIVKAFGREGKVLVTHAGEHLAGPKLSPRQARDLAELGAVIELTAMSCQEVWGIEGKKPEDMVAMIREIGHEHCALSSDYGWNTALPRAATGFKDFLECLWSHGLPEADLTTMAAANPARLLGLH